MCDGHVRAPDQIRAVYDRIAAHFAKTRVNPWPEVEAFVSEVDAGTVGLDIGCGNGRHAEVLARKSDSVLAVDLSRGSLREARERVAGSVGLAQADAARLPVGTGRVDLGLYVATLHHLPDRERRRASLSELSRVLGPGGRGFVSAWSTAHDRFEGGVDSESGFDTTVDWTLPGGETVPRFYHIYAPAEFEADLAASALAVEETYVSSGNCYAEVSGDARSGI